MASNTSNLPTNDVLNSLARLPWLEIAAETWKLAKKLWRGLADEGIYEVLEYESRLELKDRNGRIAQFSKREKVRYLQNNILAYQDHAWGDGEILQDYKCTPGKVVDQYRPGQKTFLLISLRSVKKRGDVDEFRMAWGIREGFARKHELWETEVRHRTQKMQVTVVFPKSRLPKRVWVEEVLHRRQHRLGEDARVMLPDERLQVTWQLDKPQLNERYQIHWEW